MSDIVRANHLTNPDNVANYTHLTIPNPPQVIRVGSTTHRLVRVNGDRIGVRIGPGEGHRRMGLVDKGTPVTVTAERGEWSQVIVPSGRVGWIKSIFLAHSTRAEIARATPREERKPTRRVRRHSDESDERVARAARSRRRAAKASARAESRERRRGRLAAAEERPRHRRHHSEAQVARLRSRGSKKELGGDIVRTAFAYRGTPYRFGGISGRGFDCSGFTSYIYSRKGVSLPHSAKGQFETGRAVDRGHLKPGDLVFFHTVTNGISHVGMYVGNGRFVHASSRREGGVRVDNLSSGYYNERFRGARRVRK